MSLYIQCVLPHADYAGILVVNFLTSEVSLYKLRCQLKLNVLLIKLRPVKHKYSLIFVWYAEKISERIEQTHLTVNRSIKGSSTSSQRLYQRENSFCPSTGICNEEKMMWRIFWEWMWLHGDYSGIRSFIFQVIEVGVGPVSYIIILFSAYSWVEPIGAYQNLAHCIDTPMRKVTLSFLHEYLFRRWHWLGFWEMKRV